jgi:hypothetical protein
MPKICDNLEGYSGFFNNTFLEPNVHDVAVDMLASRRSRTCRASPPVDLDYG